MGCRRNRGTVEPHPVVGPQQQNTVEAVAPDGPCGMGRSDARVRIPGMGHDQGPQVAARIASLVLLIGLAEEGVDHARQILATRGIEPPGPGRLAHFGMTGARRPQRTDRQKKNRREKDQKTHGGHKNALC